MNYMSLLELERFRSSERTIPISDFFVKTKIEKNDKKKNRKVEEIIDNYSLEFYDYVIDEDNNDDNSYFLLIKEDFDEMINDIQKTYISSNYRSLFSWLIDRCFVITNRVKANRENIQKINKNRSLLFKTLYTVNPKMFLECFKKDSEMSDFDENLTP